MRLPHPDTVRLHWSTKETDPRKRFSIEWPAFPWVPTQIKERIENYINDPKNIIEALESGFTYAVAAQELKKRAFSIWNWLLC